MTETDIMKSRRRHYRYLLMYCPIHGRKGETLFNCGKCGKKLKIVSMKNDACWLACPVHGKSHITTFLCEKCGKVLKTQEVDDIRTIDEIYR